MARKKAVTVKVSVPEIKDFNKIGTGMRKAISFPIEKTSSLMLKVASAIGGKKLGIFKEEEKEKLKLVTSNKDTN